MYVDSILLNVINQFRRFIHEITLNYNHMFLGARLKIVVLLVENASYVREYTPQSRHIHFLNYKGQWITTFWGYTLFRIQPCKQYTWVQWHIKKYLGLVHGKFMLDSTHSKTNFELQWVVIDHGLNSSIIQNCGIFLIIMLRIHHRGEQNGVWETNANVING